MPFTPTITPGYIFTPNEEVTNPKLNQLGNPLITVTGAAGTSEITDYAITPVKSKLGAYSYGGLTTGSNVAYLLDFPAGQESALTDGLLVNFKAHATCGLNPTLNVDGTGAHLFTKFDGTALAAGDFITNQIIEARYSVVGVGHWQIINQVPVASQVLNVAGWGGDGVYVQAHRDPTLPDSKIVMAHGGMVVRHRTTGAVAFAPAIASLTADITVPGLGGLDTGTEAASSWYYIWVYWDGTTQYAVLSLNNIVPALIGAYHYVGLVGVVRNTGASNFNPFYTKGRRTWVPDGLVGTGLTGPGSGGATVMFPVGVFPPLTQTVLLRVGKTDNTPCSASFAPDFAMAETQVGLAATAVALNGFMACATVEIPLTNQAQFYWRTGDVSTTYRIMLCGYTI